MYHVILRIIRRFPHALRGLYEALTTDFSFQTQWYGGLLSAAILLLWAWPLLPYEWLFLGLGLALLFITELQNSSLEATLDHLHPDIHDAIRKSKDYAAAAVLIAGGFYGLIIIIIVGSRLLA